MTIFNKAVLFILLLLVGKIYSYADEYDIYGENSDVVEKKWVEQAVTIPAFPQENNLLELSLYHSSTKYYIDKKSVQVGKQDRVARYTVVIKTASGAKNVFYEGIRCDTKTYRTYAYAVNMNSFRAMPNSIWRPITGVGVFKYRLSLFDYFVCKDSAVRPKVRDIIQALIHPSELHAPEQVD